MRLLLILAALSPALPALAEDVPLAVTGTYLCGGGQRIEVAYLNPPGIPSLAVLAWDGRLIPMQAGPTGSGVRYLSIDSSKLVWHTKGDAGFLAHDDAGETMILSDCAMQPG